MDTRALLYLLLLIFDTVWGEFAAENLLCLAEPLQIQIYGRKSG